MEPEEIADDKLRRTAISLVLAAKYSERDALQKWLEKLLEIHGGSGSTLQKTKDALAATRDSKIVWRLIKLIAKEARRLGWDERSNRTRWATVAAGASLVAFGGQSAGIAALGGAIGVPLWVVFGGGAAFARIILDELQRSKETMPPPNSDRSKAHRGTIEGDYVDITPEE